MKTIIDCGGWRGDSVEPLREKWGYCFVHTFECVPSFFEYYKNFKDHELHKKAVWIYDGTINIYLQDNLNWDGHSLCEEKKVDPVIAVKHPFNVECIDFSRWIKDNFTKDDELYLKMNIEGAEYKVLQKMLIDNTIDYFNDAIIHYHQPRYPKIVTKEEHEKIVFEVGKRLHIS